MLQDDPPAQRVKPGALVTVAFLKARLDEGDDHLGIFMPLLLDTLEGFDKRSFTTHEASEALAAAHGITMPQATVSTLLRRATRKHHLTREAGRFQLNPDRPLRSSKVAAQREQIAESLASLGRALQGHSERRGLKLATPDDALDKLLDWLETEQVAVLLGEPPPDRDAGGSNADTSKEHGIIAEFLRDTVSGDPALQSTLRGLLEGLVLYHAAFLPDLDLASRRFKDLQVVCDTVIVRQALGYEGDAARLAMRETIDLLKVNGVKCIVFDKTVDEMRRILAMYEGRLGTEKGRRELRPGAMTRHFLGEQYSPSDMREMAALLEQEIAAAGFVLRSLPRRVVQFTSGETALAKRLARPPSKDETEPRVLHDVDCVAGVLVLRKGHRSGHVEGARAIFATSSKTVIQTTREWWEEDELEACVPPIIHIRALANLAWLKKPAARSDYKMRELVALCAAALRPSQETWRRFLKHLESLVSSGRLTSDESAVVVASALSDRLLKEAELEEEDPEDIDASTLDEVVERVKASYGAKAEEHLRATQDSYEKQIAELQSQSSSMAENLRRAELALDGRARWWARRTTRLLLWVGRVIVSAGAIALILTHPFHRTSLGVFLGLAIVVFVVLEFLGALRHISDSLDTLEVWLFPRLRSWLSGGSSNPRD